MEQLREESFRFSGKKRQFAFRFHLDYSGHPLSFKQFSGL
jgi:hypothetical protein